MMTNLFSTYDPSNSMNMSMNWTMIPITLIFMPLMYWIIPNRLTVMSNKIIMFIYNEMKMIMENSKEKKFLLMLISMFMMIMISNFLSMFPFIFPSTSHLVFSLSLALPLWLSLISFAIINKSSTFSAHLVPTGSPILISPLLVLIESVSNIIRPITLSIRLSINLTTGHMIMHILMMLSSSLMSKSMLGIGYIMIILLELMVMFIQAYVFSILGTMYSKEIH